MINIGKFKNSEINDLLLELNLEINDVTAEIVDPNKSEHCKKILMKYLDIDETSYNRLESIIPKCIGELKTGIYNCVLSPNFPEDY